MNRAAQTLGRIKSAKKAAASRVNGAMPCHPGKQRGRPKKQKRRKPNVQDQPRAEKEQQMETDSGKPEPSTDAADSALDESAGSALLPCANCGSPGAYGVIEDEDSEDWNGEYIECTNSECGMSTCLMFPAMESVKDDLAEKWNRRASLHPVDDPNHVHPHDCGYTVTGHIHNCDCKPNAGGQRP